MDLTSFPCFSLLPTEIRREIYLLATPPRVVHIREFTEEDYDEFKERLRTSLVQFKLDPSLTHFVHNWDRHIPPRKKQPTLEEFGFTSTKPRYQPWEPTIETPEIPLPWLGDNPHMAWGFTRRCHLYSLAPIPPLLHMCHESQDVLKRDGFELTFRTRTRGPRTWFNFNRDTLFLEQSQSWPNDVHMFISGSYWDCSQFVPEDMAKVQYLALERFGISLPQPGRGINWMLDDLSPVIRLFGNVKELLFVEWWQHEMERVLGSSEGPPTLWNIVDVEEIDAVMRLIVPGRWWDRYIICTAPGLIMRHRQKHGPNTDYFGDLQRAMMQQMTEYRRVMASHADKDPSSLWHIPKTRFVHVLQASNVLNLVQSREAAMTALKTLRRQWNWIRKAKQIAGPLQSIPEKERQFAGKYWPGLTHECDNVNCVICKTSKNKERKWYIVEQVEIPPPRIPTIYTGF